MDEKARKTVYALQKIAKVVSIMYPMIFQATNLISNSLLEISVPTENLTMIQAMLVNSSNTISMIKEKYQDKLTKDEDPCKFVNSVDPKGEYKKIISKDRKTKKWICKDC